MNNVNKLKKIIVERYGSTDNFIKMSNVKLSRIHVFKLISGERGNPTLQSLKALADALDMPIEEVINLLYDKDDDALHD